MINGKKRMKLGGIVTYLAVAAGSQENPKSDKDPKKRIEALVSFI